MSGSVVFLKLGGSLITNKNIPHTPQIEVIHRLADEIAAAYKINPELRIVLGHGSGSFGHIPAKKYHTRQGVTTDLEWLGFANVWKEARALNEIVLSALLAVELPVVAFPPSAFVLAQDGQPGAGEFRPLLAALQHGLIPLVNGDVIFDTVRGGTIFSTEDIFTILAPQIKPARIFLAGIEKGIWSDFPKRSHLIPRISPHNLAEFENQIQGSASTDVTGGMSQKVQSMLRLAAEIPGMHTLIFSAQEPGCLLQALLGDSPGTTISMD